jgi:polyhydroxyalkanoate synthesis regulator phasin
MNENPSIFDNLQEALTEKHLEILDKIAQAITELEESVEHQGRVNDTVTARLEQMERRLAAIEAKLLSK